MTRYNAATSSIDLRDLQQSVNALLKQIDRACHGIVERHESTNGAAVAEEELAPHLLDDPRADAADEADDDESPRQGRKNDLAAQVDDLIADAMEATEALSDEVERHNVPNAAAESALEDAAHQAKAIADVASHVIEAPSDASDARQGAADDTESSQTSAVPEATDAAADDQTVSSAIHEAPTSEVRIEEFDGAADPADAAEPVVATADEAPAPATDADSAAVAIKALDATIEAEAEALEDELDDLEGDFESVDQVQSAASMRDGEARSTKSDFVASADISSDEIDSPFAGDSTQTGLAPARANTAASSAKPKSGAKKSAASGKSRKAAPDRAPLRERAVSVVLIPLARPIAALDPKLRDTIGWVGVNSILIAVCLWLFLILK